MSEMGIALRKLKPIQQELQRTLFVQRKGAARGSFRLVFHRMIYASLLRAGFDAQVIRRELRALTRLAVVLPEDSPL
jgi:hypothetical protein